MVARGRVLSLSGVRAEMMIGRVMTSPLRTLSRKFSASHIEVVFKEIEDIQSLKKRDEPPPTPKVESPPSDFSSPVEVSHPWIEWVELMEMLVKKRYFVTSGSSFADSANALKDANKIRTAMLNFSRDRFDLIRCLSRKDIHNIAQCGCPSMDRKVVNSGKRLRAFVGIEEGDVCSSCNLRGECERAYIKAREDEGGRTVDVMRILLTYGFDQLFASVENSACSTKTTKESVRRLLKEIVQFGSKEADPGLLKLASQCPSIKSSEISSRKPTLRACVGLPTKQGDWICPKCNFLNFAKNLKCLRCDGLFQERIKKIREENEPMMMKKGDWLCAKCNFLNFAKNYKCLQCDEKPPKRELNSGEWECVSCNYINFRRNMVCLKCDWKRPKTECPNGNFGSSGTEKPDYSRGSRVTFVQGDCDPIDDEFWDSKDDMLLKFKDFPMRGGKSDSSSRREQGSHGLEISIHKQLADESTVSSGTNRSTPISDSDDDDISGWFRSKKLSTKHSKLS